jgi:hypothetical protein
MSILAVGLSPQYARKLIRRREIALRDKLTSQERAQVNHHQNNASRQIHEDKHDSKTDHLVQQHNAEHQHR